MPSSSVQTVAPAGPDAPVVFDSPHSGSFYPADFRYAVPLSQLRSGEDMFVDELFQDGPSNGAFLIAALFPRTYIDPNRALSDLDPGMLAGPWPHPLKPGPKSERGTGLIFRKVGDGALVYDRLLGAAEVQRRIDLYWRPYHDALNAAIEGVHRKWGAVWHINCHSMQGVGSALSTDQGRVRADFVLGDRDGTTCDAAFSHLIAETLKGMGYSVVFNDPFKGVEIVRVHGRPAEARHSLQIEINRRRYMDGNSLQKTAGFDALQKNIGTLCRTICDYARAQAGG
jgi:N-formylglutamate deformylase